MNLDLKQEPMGPSEMPSMDYPTFSFETTEEHSLPASGTMTIQFKKKSSTEENQEGETRYRCTVEVRKIVEVSGGKGAAGDGKEAEEGSDEEEATETADEEAQEQEAGKGDSKKGKRSPAVAAVLGKGDY